MPQGNDLPNVFRTDVQAYVLIDGQRYPVSLVEFMYRPDELPYAYVEIPVGRKAPKNPPTSTSELTGAGEMIAGINPMTPLVIMVKCTAYGNPPMGPDGKQKLKGYVDGQWMKVFSGYVLSPWIRKRKGGYASLALTAMGELGKLASSTSYVNTITTGQRQQGKVSIPVIVAAAGVESGVVQTVTASIEKMLPADDIPLAIRTLLQFLANSTAMTNFIPGVNSAALTSIERLIGVENDSTPTGLPIAAGSSATNLGTGEAVSSSEFNKMLQWNVARHFGELTYAGWANNLTNGGGDLWTVFQALIRSFLLSVIPTARNKDFIVPIFHGLSLPAFRTIDTNEYWAVETGKSFTPKDFAYVSEVLLYSPRGDPMLIVHDGNRGFGFNTPLIGHANTIPRRGVPGRPQVVEAPSWSVPPSNLAPKAVTDGASIPDSGALNDDKNIEIERPANEFWYDKSLGNQVASWTLGFLQYVHRVIAITGRLRFDIAPGSLIRVTFIDDLYTRKKVARYDMYGYVAEVRTTIGSRGRGTSAQTVLTLSHVHNAEEHNRVTKTEHPVYAKVWTGTHLVDGADK